MGALDGLLVLSLEQAVAAPYCSSRLADAGARVANRRAIDARVAATFAVLTRDEAAMRLRNANTAFGFVNDMAGLAAHPASRRITVGTQAGPASIVASPVVHDTLPDLGPVPALGKRPAHIRMEFA